MSPISCRTQHPWKFHGDAEIPGRSFRRLHRSGAVVHRDNPAPRCVHRQWPSLSGGLRDRFGSARVRRLAHDVAFLAYAVDVRRYRYRCSTRAILHERQSKFVRRGVSVVSRGTSPNRGFTEFAKLFAIDEGFQDVLLDVEIAVVAGLSPLTAKTLKLFFCRVSSAVICFFVTTHPKYVSHLLILKAVHDGHRVANAEGWRVRMPCDGEVWKPELLPS